MKLDPCPECRHAVGEVEVSTIPGREHRPIPWMVVTAPDVMDGFVLQPCGHVVEHIYHVFGEPLHYELPDGLTVE